MQFTGFSFHLDDDMSRYRFEADLVGSKAVIESLGYQRNSVIQNFRLSFDLDDQVEEKICSIIEGSLSDKWKSGSKPSGRGPGWGLSVHSAEGCQDYCGTSPSKQVTELRNALLAVSDSLVDSIGPVSGMLDVVRLIMVFDGGSCRYEYRRGMNISVSSYTQSAINGGYYEILDSDQDTLLEAVSKIPLSEQDGEPGPDGEITVYYGRGYFTIRCGVFKPAWWDSYAESLADCFEGMINSGRRKL